MTLELLRIGAGSGMALLVLFIAIRFLRNWLEKQPEPLKPIKHVRHWNREKGTR